MKMRDEATRRWAMDLYAKNLWVVWGVDGDESSAPFTYTSGGVLTNRPDIIIQGVVGPATHGIVNAIMEAIPHLAPAEYFQQIHTLEDFAIGDYGDARYQFKTISQRVAYAWGMYAAFNDELIIQDKFCLIELADRQNRLPGEPGYEEWRTQVNNGIH